MQANPVLREAFGTDPGPERLPGRRPNVGLWLLLAVVGLLSVSPTLRLVGEALTGWEAGAEAPLLQVLREPGTWRAMGNSLYTSVLGTLLAGLLGTFWAGALTLTDVRGRAAWAFAAMLPMMIPPQITALAWLQLTGPASPLLKTLGLAPPLGSPQPLYSANGIALLLGIQHAPLVFLALRSSLLALPAELVEAARLCGARQRRLCLDVLMPLAWPGLLAGMALAFVSALGNFGIPALLGIPAGYSVLPTLIYQKLAGFGPAVLPQAAVLSLLVGGLALLGIALQERLRAQDAYRLLGRLGQPASLRLGRTRWLVEALLLVIALAVLGAPLLALLVGSLVPAQGVPLRLDTLTFAAYREMLSSQGVTLRALGNSLLLSAGAAVALMLLALPLAWRLVRRPGRLARGLAAAVEVPYALPGVVLAIACILLFGRPLPLLGYSLYGSLALILIAYLARFLVVALKPLQTSLAQVDPALEEAAQLAGAGPWRRACHILLPLLAPALAAGGLLVFLTAINELTVSALLWSAGNETLGVLIFNLDESGDNVLACAVAVLIVALVATLMGVLGLLARRLPKGVIPWQS